MFAPFLQPRQLQGEALQIEAIARLQADTVLFALPSFSQAPQCEQPEADSEHAHALFQRCLA
ncbi:hypothetical protein LNV23_01315 [Paucibacter sp. DJ1R-11]|uniref:hypothetical protein n=1 Tax=Paucibacter sp. DJ1R-11 TaxID=2893556 RepID=UPI0021E3B302|nr:hypothetical protein [Paucibacter sp. DJ1R-11]MCV2362086.1 hypothetical protein [Paucibacter sp. DJ1R-11]